MSPSHSQAPTQAQIIRTSHRQLTYITYHHSSINDVLSLIALYNVHAQLYMYMQMYANVYFYFRETRNVMETMKPSLAYELRNYEMNCSLLCSAICG